MQASHGSTGAAGTRTMLPVTEHAFAELGSLYPVFAYCDLEMGTEQPPAEPGSRDHSEELDEVIFAGLVAMR